MTKFNQNLADSHKQKLQTINNKLYDGGTLSSIDKQVISNYYDFVSASGYNYGAAANHIVHNEGVFGETANNYFEIYLDNKDYSSSQIFSYKDQFMADLALRDVTMRTNPELGGDSGNISYENIKQYHLDSLDGLGLPKEAWGGSFLDVFGGAGASMDLGGFDSSPDISQLELTNTLLHLAIGEDVVKDGVSAQESFMALMKASGNYREDSELTELAQTFAESLGSLNNTYSSNYKNYKHFWDRKLEQEWELNETKQLGSIKEGIPTIKLQDQYSSNFNDFKFATIYDKLGGAGDRARLTESNLINLAKGYGIERDYVTETPISTYIKIGDNFYRKIDNNQFVKDNYASTSDSAVDNPYNSSIAIKDSAGKISNNEKVSGDTTILLANSGLVATDAIYVDSDGNPISAADAFYVFEDENGKKQTIKKEGVQVIAKDGNKYEVESLETQQISKIEAFTKFISKEVDTGIKPLNILLNNYRDDIAADILSQIILGESAEEAAQKTLKYFASKAVADSLISDISFIDPKTPGGGAASQALTKFATDIMFSHLNGENMNSTDYLHSAIEATATGAAYFAAVYALGSSAVGASAGAVTGVAAGNATATGTAAASGSADPTGVAVVVAVTVAVVTSTIDQLEDNQKMNSEEFEQFAINTVSNAIVAGITAAIAVIVPFPVGAVAAAIFARTHGQAIHNAVSDTYFSTKSAYKSLEDTKEEITEGVDKVLSDNGFEISFNEILSINSPEDLKNVLKKIEDSFTHPDDTIKNALSLLTDYKSFEDLGKLALKSTEDIGKTFLKLAEDIANLPKNYLLDVTRAQIDLFAGGYGQELAPGEYWNPEASTRIIQKDDGSGNVVFALNQDGTLARARDGFDDDIVGSNGNDVLVGGSGSNIIQGKAGNDHIEGRSTDDQLFGGTGDDLIEAGAGDDAILGEDGNDIIHAGSGNDQIDAGSGNDIVVAGSGNDVVVSGDGKDVVYGNEGDDQIASGSGDDIVVGGLGSDTITGGDGRDRIYGSQGLDNISGNAGNDILIGGDNDDTISGGDNDDQIIGGSGVDMLYGDSGHDTIAGGTDNDLIFGGLGNDEIGGGSGDDTLSGEIGDDMISGGDGIDTIDGGDGIDIISGDIGNDILAGGAGDDTYIFKSGDGQDEITETSGTLDTLRFIDLDIANINFTKLGNDLVVSFIGSTDSVTIKDNFSGNTLTPTVESLEFTQTGIDGGNSIDLTALTYDSGSDNFNYTATNAVAGDVTLQNVLLEDTKGAVRSLDNFYHNMQGVDLDVTEQLYANVDYEFYNDIQWKSYKKKRSSFGGHYTVWYKYYEKNINGFDNSDDRLVGNWWDEIINGKSGDDFLYGNAGNDTIYGEDGNDFLEGGYGDDTLYGGAGGDNLEGGSGNDKLISGTGDDKISTGEGNDEVEASSGNNTIVAEYGNNTIMAGDGDNVIEVGSGNDEITLGDGSNIVNLGDGDNTLTLGDGNNLIDSGDGSDAVKVGDGNNNIRTGSGNDYINAGNGDNFVDLGDGDDLVVAGNGNNIIYAGNGNDDLFVGSGDNTIYLGYGDDELTIGLGNNTIISDAGNNVINVSADPLANAENAIDEFNDINNPVSSASTSFAAVSALSASYLTSVKTAYGNDQITIESGDAIVSTGSGDDAVKVSSGSHYINLSEGNNNLKTGEGESVVNAADGNNTIVIDDGNHEVNLGDGDNTVVVGNGDSNIEIEDGNNDVTLGAGNYNLDLGDGNNVLNLAGEALVFDHEYYIQNYEEEIPDLGLGNEGNAKKHFEEAGKYKNYNPNQLFNTAFYISVLKENNIELAENQTPYDHYLTTGQFANYQISDQIQDTQNTVNIGSGDNTIYGDNSADILNIGDGDNIIKTRDGDDQITLGEGSNNVNTGQGDDQITAKDGSNNINTGDGSDIVNLGNGSNIVDLGNDNDQITVGTGNNEINLGSGDDTITTSGGDNIIEGGQGDDALTGGEGNNTYVYNLGDGNDTINEAGGTDTIEFKDLRAKDVTLSKDNNNLNLLIKGTGHIVAITNYFVADNNTIDILKFSDDYEINLGEIFIGTDEKDTTQGTEGEDQALLGGGNDIILGFEGNDYLNGGSGDDLIYAGENDDIIEASSGNDYLDGGAGNDILKDGAGNDRLFGGSGNDTFVITKSADSNDVITDFNIDEDTLDLSEFGQDFVDLKSIENLHSISKDQNNNAILNLGNNQTLTLTGIVVEDLNKLNINFDIAEKSGLIGDNQNNILTGTQNDDEIFAGSGLDILTGNAGNDKFVIQKNANGVDVVEDFKIGEDIIKLDGLSEIDFSQLQVAQKGDDAIVTFSDNQKVILRNTEKSTLTKDSFEFNQFNGIGQHQRYQGEYTVNDSSVIENNEGIGSDIIDYLTPSEVSGGFNASGYESTNFFNSENIHNDGIARVLTNNEYAAYSGGKHGHWYTARNTSFSGQDSYYYKDAYGKYGVVGRGQTYDENNVWAQNENTKGSQGKMTVHYNSGNDKMHGNWWGENIYANSGHDQVYGNGGNDSLFGGNGNDELHGGTGNDAVHGQNGHDYLLGGTGNDSLYGGSNNDMLSGGTGNDYLNGGAHDDKLDGGTGNDQLHGADGNDYLYGAVGSDGLYGGNGSDYLDGGDNNDYLDGGRHNDTLYGGEGFDNLQGGSGNDVLFGGVGNDNLNGDIELSFNANHNTSGFEGTGFYGNEHNSEQLIGDFNGDGKDDILNVQWNGDNWVSLSNGNGTFSTNHNVAGFEGTGFYGSFNHSEQLIGDFNGDGNDDILNVQWNGDNWVSLSNGDGTFSTNHNVSGFEGAGFYGNEHNSEQLIGDFNGDGNDDVLNVQWNGDNWVSLSNGNGTFSTNHNVAGFEGAGFYGSLNHSKQLIGDFNADGNDDILNVQWNGDNWVSLSNGNGTFSTNHNVSGFEGVGFYGSEYHSEQLIGDFNGDGNDDILNVQWNGDNWVSLSNGDGTFSTNHNVSGFEGVGFYGNEHHSEQLIGDFNADGNDDVLNVQWNGDNWISLSNGDGSFRTQHHVEGVEGMGFYASYNHSEQLVGDFDGDGFSDISNVQWNGDNWVSMRSTGDDTLFGQDGDDYLHGGDGNDILYGGIDNDQLFGGSGDDYLDTGYGEDKAYGGDGNDFVTGGYDDKDDLLAGDAGHDKIVAVNGNNIIDGGAGIDQIQGGDGNDIIYGNSGEDIINGGAGSDIIYGGTNADLIDGESGNDHIMGGQGGDIIYGSEGDDLLEGNEDDDTLHGGDGQDYLDGGNDNDYLNAGQGNDILLGGDGTDILNGGQGNDFLHGGLGDDVYYYNYSSNNDGSDLILENSDAGFDTIKFGSDINKDSITIKQDGVNLIIGFSENEETLTIVNQFADDKSKIEKLEFANGEELLLSDNNGNSPQNALVLNNQGQINFSASQMGSFFMINEDDQIKISVSSDLLLENINTTNGVFAKDEAGENLIFTPNQDFFGLTNLSYELKDAEGNISEYNLTVAINSVNDAPVVNLVETELNEDSSITIDVLANATDVEDGQLSNLEIGIAKHGKAELTSDNKIIYTPNPDYFGTDSFEYSVTDSEGLTTTKTLNVIINNIEDTPVVVDELNIKSAEDQSITIDIADHAFDADGDELTVTSTTDPANGAVTIDGSQIIYTPNSNYNGADSFDYIISDGTNELTKTINLEISSENDAPIVITSTTEVQEDGAVIIDIIRDVIDSDGDNLTIDSISNPTNGAAEIIENKIVYVPKNNYFGDDSLIYTISDGNGGYVTKKLDININSVNDAPIVEISNGEVREDEILTINVLKGSSDIENDSLTVTEVKNVTGGYATIVNNEVIYIPDQNYHGNATLEYVVSDGENEVSKTLSILVESVNDLPVAILTESSLNEDSSVNIDVLSFASDVDGDILNITGVTNPSNGKAIVENGKITYTPDANYFGTDSFDYLISDGNGGLVIKTLNLTINNVNDAPEVTIEGVINIREDNVATINILDNVEDLDGDTLSLVDANNAQNGNVIIEDGSIIYTPDENYFGSENIIYTVSDGTVDIVNELTINIDSVNDAPIATNDQVNILEDNQVIIDLLDNDFDIEDKNLKRENILLGGALHGIVFLDENNQATYKANANYFGTDQFIYAVKDSQGVFSNIAQVDINIASVNDAPIIGQDFKDQMIRAGEVNTIQVSDNVFRDVDGDDLTISLKMADGSEAPEWLVYDSINKTITSNATDDNIGTMNLILTADDGEYQKETEFTLVVQESLQVRNDERINIIEATSESDLVSANIGTTDLIFSGDGNDDIVYNIDDVWGEGYVAYNSYTGDTVDISGKIRSFDAFDGGKGDVDTLYLTEGDDSIFLHDLISDNPTISGSRLFGIEVINALGGSDVIDLSSDIFTYGSVTINGSEGDDVLWSNDGNDTINGEGGNDSIIGGKGDDIIFGGEGDDILKGYDDDDTLIGGLGQDILEGGNGKDIFEFTGLDQSVSVKADIIKDFESGVDLITISNSNLSFSNLTISNDGSNTTIEVEESDFAITLNGVFNLSEDDFLIA